MSGQSMDDVRSPLYWIIAAVVTAAVFIVAERVNLDALGSSLSEGLGLRQSESAGLEGRR